MYTCYMKKLYMCIITIFLGVLGILAIPIKSYKAVCAVSDNAVENAKDFTFGQKVNYVSLGDSIAVGYSLDSWLNNGKLEFGSEGLNSTPIYQETYAESIYNDLKLIYGDNNVSAVSYAHSGDKVKDLLLKLEDQRVINSLKDANIVTISIGANDILGPATEMIQSYLMGEIGLSEITNALDNGLNSLTNGGGDDFSDLLNRLNEINSKAKYIFTNVYNPYKYFDVDIEAFLNPILPPPFDIGIGSLTTEIDLAEILDDVIFDSIESRIDNIRIYTEYYLSGNSSMSITGLNPIVKSTIESYQNNGFNNFYLVDTKSVFDSFPQKSSSNLDVDYSDLVNVELTEDSKITEFNYGNYFPDDYWLSWANKIFFNGYSKESFANDLLSRILETVLEDTDPHPEWRGHIVISNVFKNVVSAVVLNIDETTKYGLLAINGQTVELPTPYSNGKIFTSWFKDENLTSKWNEDVDVVQSLNNSTNFGSLANGGNVASYNIQTTNLYGKWTQLELDGSEKQTILTIGNAKKVSLTIAVGRDANIEWYDNDKKISGQNGEVLEYKPKKFGTHRIYCVVDGVESNVIELEYNRLNNGMLITSSELGYNKMLSKVWNLIQDSQFYKFISKFI